MAQTSDQSIEYVTVYEVQDQIQQVKKTRWNGTNWQDIIQYRFDRDLSAAEREWLQKTYGSPGVHRLGVYWDCSRFVTAMDEQVYLMYQLKWSKQ